MPAPPEQQVRRLIGVYNAEGSLLGELRYLIGRARGTAHCALCDVTHGRVRKKPAFAEFQASYPAPIDMLHLDEQPDDIAALTRGRTPCVLAETPSGYCMVLTADDLELCHGDVDAFVDVLPESLRARELVLPDR